MSTIRRVLACLGIAQFVIVLVPSLVLAAATGSITLQWTAPGDDGLAGRASVYDLRYSLTPITAANFLNATVVPGLPTPKAAGSIETFIVPGLVTGTRYYFALKTGDEIPNWSALSNTFVDSLVVTATGSTALNVSLSPPWPNPARAQARWSYTLPERGLLEIEVFDFAGRHLRTVTSGWASPGQGTVEWDLRDDRGSSVASGVYMVRARIAGQTVVKKLVVTR